MIVRLIVRKKSKFFFVKFFFKQVNLTSFFLANQPNLSYTIRCVMSARNIILVACELEIFICFDDNQRIVIQHKRIRGASWDYFKLMTDLQLQLNQ